MAKACANCDRLGSVVDEQKSKIQLLEARLKDLLRAYKAIAKEKEDLMSINANITADVDSSQQKRIADLEESVLHMSSICGKFELERKQDKEQISQLEIECDRLRRQLETSSQVSQDLSSNHSVISSKQTKDCRNKACQTEAMKKDIDYVSNTCGEDKGTQTLMLLAGADEAATSYEFDTRIQASKAKYEMAIVAPLQRISSSVSEADDDDVSSQDEQLIEATHRMGLVEDNRLPVANSDPSVSNSGTSLFYINELARKELELAEYKLRVREHECSIRELQWKYNNEKYRLQSRIADLELLNNNFMSTSKNDRNIPTSTVNVAYIRNVLTKLLDTKDKEQKQIMINALLTALNSI